MKNKNRKGAASFYMIVVSALLFGVIAAGFITLMISEMGKSSENNLSQSAYDSALAGIEDAKMLLIKYNNCKNITEETDKPEYCSKVETAIETKLSDSDCNDLGDTTGKVASDGGYLIQELTEGEEVTVQAYTCIDINFRPKDYLGTLSAESPTRLIPLQADDNSEIKNIRISWYSVENLGENNTAFQESIDKESRVTSFSNNASTPPVLVASIYQAPIGFSLDNFKNSYPNSFESEATNRGTLWLIPSNSSNDDDVLSDEMKNIYYESSSWNSNFPKNSEDGEAVVTDKSKTITLKESALLASNVHSINNMGPPDRSIKTTHFGFPILCADESKKDGVDYLCSVSIDLPDMVVDSASKKTNIRSNEAGTFLLFLNIPYGQPTTDFKVEMSDSPTNPFNGDESYKAKEFNNVQVIIDSTGRANNVYSRVENRLEFYDSSFPFPDYTLSLGEGDGGYSLWKDFTTSDPDSDGCWYSSWDTAKTDPTEPTPCSK